MRKLFLTTGTGSVAISWILVWVCFMAIVRWANAAELKKARVTQIIKDVKLLPGRAAPRPAAVSDDVRQGTAVRTGVESRAELTFTDLTITRLGANTIFSFNEGTRELNLGSGAILVSAPKDAPAIQIATPAFTGGVTGGTAILEFNKGAPSKFLILEGHGRFCPKANPNGCVDVPKGQMVVMTADGRVIGPFEFNAGLVYESSLLITDFPPLPNAYLIQETIAEQQNNQAGSPPNPFAPDLIDIVDQRFAATPTLTPTPPTLSEFGPPSVISSPVPYVITSGTVITTDPTITTNGVTDLGKVWRGSARDGRLSAFIFGSTSAFDKAIGLDAGAEKVADSGAVFKFTSLELAGNPTVSTANGQINLALIGVNGITSGGPGGNLTFTGISTLLLATQDGSINLGPEISFSGFQHLVFYARGAGSNLTLASPVSATIHLALAAEGSIQVSSVNATLTAERIRLFAGDSIILNGGVMSATAANSSGNVNILAGNQISITKGLEIDRTFGGQSSGLNVSLSAGTDFTLGSSLVVNIDNSVNGNLDSGANITLNSGGNLTINGDGALTLHVLNNDGGHIGAGGNISVTTGGDLRTGSIDALINNRNGGSIDSGGNLTFNIGGALITKGDANFITSNRNDGAGGGTMGSNVFLNLNAASVSIAGGLQVAVSANAGGNIVGSAFNNVTIAGDLMTQGEADFLVQATGFNTPDGPFIAGGTIGGDAIFNLNARNVSTGDILEFEIGNNGAGHIGGNAVMNIAASGNISSQGDAFFDIINNNSGPSGTPPGTIGGDATINLAAANISIGGSSGLEAGIFSGRGGNIGGNAMVNVAVSGDISTETDASFDIFTFVGGIIGSNATINMNAANISVGGALDVTIGNTGGTIGGNATINMNVSGNATVTNDATFEILGSDGAAAAAINFNGGSYDVGDDVGGTFLALIDGHGTITFNNASVHADVLKVGALGTNGVLNIGGGTLSADSTLKLYANSSNGTVNFTANVTLTGAGAKIIAGDTVKVFDGVRVTIGVSPADIYTNNAHYSSLNGGDGTTTGMFTSSGFTGPAVTTHLGATPPPFDDSGLSPATVTSGGNGTRGKRTGIASGGNVTSGKRIATAINVSNTAQLLSLLDGAAPSPDGKLTVPASNSTRNLRNTKRPNDTRRLNSDSREVTRHNAQPP